MKLLSYWFCRGRPLCLPVILFIFLITACSSSSNIEQPNIQYAEKFTYADKLQNTTIDQNWWAYFESEKLNNLMLSASQQSVDLQIISERVKQAELQLSIANASWFPTLNASASSGERNSKNSGADNFTTSQSTSVGVSLQYEVDLWGGVSAFRRASKARANASLYDQQAAALSVKAAIASGWFDYLALQERIKTAKGNIAIAENIQRIVDAKYRNGAANAGEVAQQKTNLLSQQASLLPLELQVKQVASALAILLGQSPIDFIPEQENLLSISVPDILPGTPVDLILRRPDLAASESDLIAARADIVQARSALLPGISLSANAGKSASELFSLNPATTTNGWAVSLAQTLFAGGRIVNQKRVIDSRAVEMLLQYHKSILIALQEVDDGLASASIAKEQELRQQEIVKQAEISLHIAETRYRQGSNELINLLDAQRTFAQVQDALVQQRLSRLKSAITLYKTLGGGWSRQTD